MNEQERIANLKAILNQISDRDLRTFCKLQGIQLASDVTKKEIIEILTETPANTLDSFIDNAVRLELRSTELNMLEAIEKKADDLTATAQQSIDAVEEKATFLAATAQTNIDNALKGVDGVRGLLVVIGGALTLIIAVLGVFSAWRLSDLEKAITEAEKSRTKMDALQTQSTSVLSIYRRHMINQWVEGIDSVMETFSSSLPDDKLLNNFLTYRDSIGQMLELSRSVPPTQEEMVLLRIRDISQALSSVAEWKISDKFDLPDWDVKAAAAEHDWNQMGLGAPSPGTLGSFLARSNAFRSNALGIIALKRYKRNQQRVLNDLDSAVAYFNEAVTHDKTYGRAYGNQGVVYYYKFLRSEDPKERRKLIADAVASHIQSASYPERSGSGRSRTFNNIAAFSFLSNSTPGC